MCISFAYLDFLSRIHILNKKRNIISVLIDKEFANNKLNEATTKIQLLINQAILSQTEITNIVDALKQSLNSSNNESDIIDYVNCCIILAKHDTTNKTVINWFGEVNTTTKSKQLINNEGSTHTVVSDQYL